MPSDESQSLQMGRSVCYEGQMTEQTARSQGLS